ncbi:MAG: tRNA lysidine(34) synthetase TilS [Bacteroidales bacterium]|jgi:tRNA(Ile)-lysidine synthase
MLDRFTSYVADNNLFTKEQRVLSAVSGGIDSVVMLYLMTDAGFQCDIAHCNFQLRGAESDEDENFVRTLASEFKLKCHVKRFDTIDYSNKKKISVQMAARELRYNWFHELGTKFRYDCIAIAHNRDDLVETMLINLSRGTGLKGLTGIKPKQSSIVRPLLYASRDEIEFYAGKQRIAYREDSSNEDIKYRRNLIRHRIIPEFEKLNPSFKDTLIQESGIFSSAYRIYKRELEKIEKAISIEDPERKILSVPKILSLRVTPEILHDMLDQYGFSYSTIQNVCKVLKGAPGKLFYSENYILLKDRETIIIEAFKNKSDDEIVELANGTMEINYPLHLRFIQKMRNKDFIVPVEKRTIAVDSDRLSYPLKLRKWQKGDFFYPLGMNHKQKLSDYFINNKINRLDKERIWILTSGNDVLWIIGHQIDNRFKVTSNTKNLMLIALEE